ncbi:MAG: ABC transporter permease [Gemmatimonadaceae bacterium]|nr:ABC transporter permease [Gemmatimonadota bacterium]MCC7323574.1 ABC transporter permease [Gemmatimonadaceae bacterium]MBK8056492.1 ABC transporter permease [Gemmatimonadota bacterium]MBK8647184.1 ABC transporter permease [Gemmatimonadota bacterium]MBK9408403.1 ABC transporter permease [Gemmatimonadota bacterium]
MITSPMHGTHRPTEEFPVVQRTGIRVFRSIGHLGQGLLADVGERTYFLRDMLRAFATEWRTYLPLTFAQMRRIGVDSLPLTVIVAAFIGSVIALQTRYQLFPGVQLSVVGLISRQMIILELGPLLTGLVLTGRVGARMTAEIGTMRVTEQIDALETLSYDPVAYLIVPRFIAATLMLPLLVIFANAVGVTMAGFTSLTATDVSWQQFSEGLRMSYTFFQIAYSLIKATIFGAAIAFLCSYEGFVTDVGAEGVGRSTAKAVVVTSVAILVLDALTASLLANQLQG